MQIVASIATWPVDRKSNLRALSQQEEALLAQGEGGDVGVLAQLVFVVAVPVHAVPLVPDTNHLFHPNQMK